MKKILVVLGLLALVFWWKVGGTESKLSLIPPEILGGPVRLNDKHGDRLYYLKAPVRMAVARPSNGMDWRAMVRGLAIDLKTGTLNSFNPDVHRDWPAEEIPKPTP